MIDQSEMNGTRRNDRPVIVAPPSIPVTDGIQVREMLGLWLELDEHRLAFMREALGQHLPVPSSWSELSSWALQAGIADWIDQPRSIAIRRPIVGGLAKPSADALEAQAARRLMTCWFANPEPALMADALRWAILLEAWEAVGRIWTDHLPSLDLVDELPVRAVFEDLPRSARAMNPMLTFAWAAARATNAQGYRSDGEYVRSVVADGLAFHSHWANAPRTDTAVAAGTMWMLAQRMLPAGHGGSGIEDANRTGAEVSTFIAERRAEGRAPSPAVEAAFRSASAQLALAGGELARCVAEAEFAITLEPRLAEDFAVGTRDLALEMLGCSDADGRQVGPPLRLAWFRRGLGSQDALSRVLVRVIACLRTLDREGARAAMVELDGLALGQPQWTIIIYVQAVYAALWGDAAMALGQLDSAKVRQGVASTEHQEGLGSTLLRRARSLLLSRLGASAAALDGLKAIPTPWRWAPLALAQLWAGDAEEAIRSCDSGIFDGTTLLTDRVSLKLIRAGSMLVDVEADETSRTLAAVEAVSLCSAHSYWLPIGLLPANVRDALLDCVESQPGAGRLIDTKVLKALRQLPRVGESLPRAISLTKREQILLPLLASSESVPDIAATLQVSVNTVRKQVVALRAKFGATSRSELVRKARDSGLLRR
ncbi:regulatory LuxR family protein [Propionicimonas paludicola]|uniref:Regulatory LuxR family protein n=1 Tax=Propionicimonas paludicola TaxID=185243 RepID=A0A2A9CSQ8_9ACTN|nr:LuxR C-terminal-related transcriptional regulator [Propionicimonas paludicola]PFG17454.1 regulatory LuxR family protein [Propionicimonas paludicola]